MIYVNSKTLISGWLSFLVGTIFIVVLVALNLPKTDPIVTVQADVADGKLIVMAASGMANKKQTTQKPTVIEYFVVLKQELADEADGEKHNKPFQITKQQIQTTIKASPMLAIEEPDMLGAHTVYNTFMREQSMLSQALDQNRLVALSKQGAIRLAPTKRSLRDLPVLFWYQLFIGVSCFIVGITIHAYGGHSKQTLYYALTGIGLAMSTLAAAIYSTRELLLEGNLFYVLSMINYAGSLVFTAALTALLFTYPTQIGSHKWTWAFFSYMAICVLIAHLQLFEGTGSRSGTVLALFSVSLLLVVIQYLRTRKHASQRGAFRWFILSILSATLLFAGAILLPNALGLSVQVSQGWMFGAFLIMYIGLALGLIRYKIFELQAWWFSIWTWLLGGLLVILLDVFLFSLFEFTHNQALLWSLALAGWVYFPIRQWLMRRLSRINRQAPHLWLEKVLPLFSNLRPEFDQTKQMSLRWHRMLSSVFEPLTTESNPVGANMQTIARIENNGEQLRVCPVSEALPEVVLKYPSRGRQLFTRDDIKKVEQMYKVMQMSLSISKVRDEGMQTERARLARDLHDDIGARLVSLLPSASLRERKIIQEALSEMRLMLESLDQKEKTLGEAVAEWRLSISAQLLDAGFKRYWDSDIKDDSLISSYACYHLSKILKEATNNIVKYAAGTPSYTLIQTPNHELQIVIQNRFEHTSVQDTGLDDYANLNLEMYFQNNLTNLINLGAEHKNLSGGQGLANIKKRIDFLQGSLARSSSHGEFVLRLSIPLYHENSIQSP